MYGVVTDINVWSHSLTDMELSAWSNCNMHDGGDIINWDNLQLNLDSIEDDKKNYCVDETTKVMAVHNMKGLNFEETKIFCRKIGGVMAVASDPQKFDQITKGSTQGGLQHFFLGYTDKDTEGIWVDTNTKKQLSYNFWRKGSPSNNSEKNCAVFEKGSGVFDADCSDAHLKLTPVCEISNYPTKFRLRGGCAEFDEGSFLLDEDYLMVSGTLFQGFKQTRIFFNRKLILVHCFFFFFTNTRTFTT